MHERPHRGPYDTYNSGNTRLIEVFPGGSQPLVAANFIDAFMVAAIEKLILLL